jgi:uncharacterized protein (DUF952 family)
LAVATDIPDDVSALAPPAGALYKICPRQSWSEALERGALPISRDDLRDGYVHLSAAHQLRGSLDKHFAGQSQLVLLVIPSAGLPPDALRWELSRGGELFPHLYAELRCEFVRQVIELTRDADGGQLLPLDL